MTMFCDSEERIQEEKHKIFLFSYRIKVKEKMYILRKYPK